MATMEFGAKVPEYELLFEELSCVVRAEGKRGEEKTILKNVSGRFRPGRLTAVIGPSGSGKTTLMNILSGFRTKGVKGRVTVGGKDRVARDFRRYSCYIEQEVAMMTHLTAHETMKVASRLKMPPGVTNEHMDKTVEKIAELLGLNDCLNTLVCRLSGGEKKRLSIAVELVTNPPIMFFDEPTSNLDSSASRVVLQHLRWLANGGRTVICVVHQPSSHLFSMFDDLLALCAGEILYRGPSSDLVPFLASLGFHCPEFYNPSDFVIEVACREHGDDLNKLLSASRTRWKEEQTSIASKDGGPEENGGATDALLPTSKEITIEVSEKGIPIVSFENEKYGPRSSLKTQLSVLLWRTSICTYRNLYLAQLTLFGHLFVGFLLGGIFYDIGGDAFKAVSNAGCLFFFLLFLFFANAMPTVQTYPIEMPVIVRQYRNGWFSLRTYFIAKSIADIPMQILSPSLFLVAAYYLTGQPLQSDRILMVWMICVAYTAVAQGIGLVFGAAFDVDFAVFLVPLITIPMLLFSGFFVHLDALPSFISGLSYVSHSRYAYEGTMQAVYGFNRTSLSCSEAYCYFRQPEKLLDEMNLNDVNYWMDLGALLIFLLLIKIALYIVLLRKVSPSQ